MTALIEVNTDYAGDEKLQQVIIKCLDEDDDRTIGKKVRNSSHIFLIFRRRSHIAEAAEANFFENVTLCLDLLLHNLFFKCYSFTVNSTYL